MTLRQKLIPAVILGATGLLALKAISWSMGDIVPLAQQVAPRHAVVASDGSYDPEQFQGWTRMWARAREPYIIPSPEVTGSVTKPEEKPDPKKPAEQPMPPQGQLRNLSGVMNTGERPLSPSERALAERLNERREEMEARLRELDMREKLLETAERKLQGRVTELKANEEKTEAKREGAAGSEAQTLKNLVIMYENMKPRDAARVFDRLPADVLIPVVMQMNPRKMSEVLASMSPEAAEKLTVGLASRARGQAIAAAAPAAQPMPSGELPAIAPAVPAASAAPAPAARRAN